MAYTLAALIACGGLIVLLCIAQVRLAKRDERIRTLEQECDSWKLAAEHWTQVAESRE